MGSQLSCEIIRLRDKANKFNRLRIQSAQALMKKEELNIFQSLPLLFHFNLPTLPGYINHDVPTGICQYEITDTDQQFNILCGIIYSRSRHIDFTLERRSSSRS